MRRRGWRNALGPIDAGSRQAQRRPPAAGPDRVPSATMADAEACAGLAEVHPQAGDERDAAGEAEVYSSLLAFKSSAAIDVGPLR